MADFASALVARLLADPGVAAAVGEKVHWVKIEQAEAVPYVRLQTISDPRPEHLGGYTGARVTRVQADCFAGTYGAARALASLVIAALAQPAVFTGVRFGRTKAEGPRDLGEDSAVGFIHRASLDLLVEHSLA